MNPMKLLAVLLATIMLAMSSGVAFAADDKVTLKNGEVLVGEIVEETDTYIAIAISNGGIERRVIRLRSEIESISRQAEADPGETIETTRGPERDADRGPRSTPNDTDRQIPENATRVAFLRTSNRGTGKDMVGPFLNGNALAEAADILRELPENEQPDIVVLEIDSGGGAVAELRDIINAIQHDMKKDFRVVAWIRFAISGAAFTAMNCEEIVFMSSGQMGGNVAFFTTSGGTQALEGAELQMMIEYGREVARNGRIDPNVMWAMQIFMTLSADIDADGRVTWYDDDRGEYIVSAQDKILTLNALDAEKFKVSKGTADNKQELMDVLGVTEWVEVGRDADEYLTDFRDAVWEGQARFGELVQKMAISIQLAIAARGDENEVGKHIGQVRRYLGALRSLARRAPSLERYQGLTPENFRMLEELLRDQKYEQFLQFLGAGG